VDEHGWDEHVDRLEEEGERLLGVVSFAADWAAQLHGPVQRIIDVGSGPGVGTCELARRFPHAQVVAVDASEPMLQRAMQRARSQGVAGRVSTQVAALPDGLVGLPPADLVYASMVLHHAPDPEEALRAIRGVLDADGLLLVIEHGHGASGGHVRVIEVIAALEGAGYEIVGDRSSGGRQVVIAR
jgi:ubiquinone/menaquinone biosynthesis C-methylase UbiE